MAVGRLFIFIVLSLFSLGLASPGLSAVVGEEVRGTVTGIEAGRVIVTDFMGDEKTVEPINLEALTTLQIGDQVLVKEGILTKEGGAGRSAPSPGRR